MGFDLSQVSICFSTIVSALFRTRGRGTARVTCCPTPGWCAGAAGARRPCPPPPSESRLLQRRKSLQIARFSSTEVIKIQVNPTTQYCGTKALFGQLRLWAFEIAAVGFFSCRVSCWSGAKFKKRCVITLILLKHVKLKLCMLSVNVCSTWTSCIFVKIKARADQKDVFRFTTFGANMNFFSFSGFLCLTKNYRIPLYLFSTF